MPNPDSDFANQSIISFRFITGCGNGLMASSIGEVEQSGLPPLNVISGFLDFNLLFPNSNAAIPAICQKSAFDMS